MYILKKNPIKAFISLYMYFRRILCFREIYIYMWNQYDYNNWNTMRNAWQPSQLTHHMNINTCPISPGKKTSLQNSKLYNKLFCRATATASVSKLGMIPKRYLNEHIISNGYRLQPLGVYLITCPTLILSADSARQPLISSWRLDV